MRSRPTVIARSGSPAFKRNRPHPTSQNIKRFKGSYFADPSAGNELADCKIRERQSAVWPHHVRGVPLGTATLGVSVRNERRHGFPDD
jgi:hypothetical protein